MQRSSILIRQYGDLRHFTGFLILFLLGGCTSLQLTSRWSNQPVNVDGSSSEWADKTATIESRKLTVGFANDTNYVYMILSTNDRTVSRMLMGQGLTVWFDPQGGRDKTFGIHYPLGAFSARSSRNGGTRPDPAGAFKGGESMSELEIVGSESDSPHRMQIMAAGGIQAKVKYEESSFVYELRVPYMSNERFPFSVRAKSGAQIGVGLETPDADNSSGGSGGASAGGGGGRGRGGRAGGSSVGSDPDRVQVSMEPLKDWMKVQLTSPDSVRVK